MCEVSDRVDARVLRLARQQDARRRCRSARGRRWFVGFATAGLLFGLLFVGAECPAGTQETKPATLRVALFPYVPYPKGMERTIAAHWACVHPDVSLKFVEWDGGYGDDPGDGVDVFETDALALDYLVQNNFAARIALDDVEEIDDIYDFALRGSMVRGELYGIPRLSCTPVLIYRRGDRDVESAKSIEDLHRVLGDCRWSSVYPPKGQGLLIDFTGGTTCAGFYLDARADETGIYSVGQALPASDDLEKKTLRRLGLLTRMAGRRQAACEACYDKRPLHFANGYGRIMIGWSERLAKMPRPSHADVRVRPLPLADSNAVNLLFVDTLVVNSTLRGRQRRLALEFANLAASERVVVESFLAQHPETKSPQYLLPVRRSVLRSERLLADAPLYADLRVLLESSPRAFRLGPNGRYWLARSKAYIREEILKVGCAPAGRRPARCAPRRR